MHELLNFLHTLTNPDLLIEYALFCGIVFSETGLLMGLFLPGDSLLFTIGVVAGAGELNIVAIIAALILAAICGVASGYTIGRITGPKIFNRPDSRFFKQEHLHKT